MQDTKKYTVTYYHVVDENALKKFLNGSLKESLKAGKDHIIYVARAENPKRHDNLYSLNKLRIRDLPKIANTHSRKEHLLKIAENEGLVEKMYFYVGESNLVAQMNGAVCWSSRFPALMEDLSQSNEIIAPAVSSRKLLKTDEVYSVELGTTFVELSETEISDASDTSLTDSIVQLSQKLSSDGKQKFSLQVSMQNPSSGSLVKKTIDDLMSIFKLSKARVKITPTQNDDIDGKFLWLDILQMQKQGTIDIVMDGHYPNEADVARKLKGCL